MSLSWSKPPKHLKQHLTLNHNLGQMSDFERERDVFRKFEIWKQWSSRSMGKFHSDENVIFQGKNKGNDTK